MSPPARPAEPDPRIERSRRRVLQAALEELGAVGYGEFAVESVATRSGVAKSTIYRHWAGKSALIADAFLTFHAQAGPDLSGGSARERLVRIVRHVAEVVSQPPFRDCIPALIDAAERDADIRAFHHRFQAEARGPLVAVLTELAAEAPGRDPDLLATSLLGAVFYRRLMTAAAFDPAETDGLVAAVIGQP